MGIRDLRLAGDGHAGATAGKVVPIFILCWDKSRVFAREEALSPISSGSDSIPYYPTGNCTDGRIGSLRDSVRLQKAINNPNQTLETPEGGSDSSSGSPGSAGVEIRMGGSRKRCEDGSSGNSWTSFSFRANTRERVCTAPILVLASRSFFSTCPRASPNLLNSLLTAPSTFQTSL